MKSAFVPSVVVLAVVGAANAAVISYVGQDPNFAAFDTAIFQDTGLANGGTMNTQPGIDTHGLNFSSVHANKVNGFWGYAFPGGDGTVSAYFNGGHTDIMRIVRLDGQDFDTIETQVGAGWGGPNAFVWASAWNDGVKLADFDLNITYGTYIGFTGGGFDELRIAVYNDAATRDQHIETNYSAGALDNFSYGFLIPTPASAALLGLGALAAARRRR